MIDMRRSILIGLALAVIAAGFLLWRLQTNSGSESESSRSLASRTYVADQLKGVRLPFEVRYLGRTQEGSTAHHFLEVNRSDVDTLDEVRPEKFELDPESRLVGGKRIGEWTLVSIWKGSEPDNGNCRIDLSYTRRPESAGVPSELVQDLPEESIVARLSLTCE